MPLNKIVTHLSKVKAIPLVSRWSPSSAHVPTLQECNRFKQAQRLAYECAVTIAGELKEGWTEQQTAKLMDVYLRDHGVKSFFHRSFAWFGERTRFQNFKRYSDFLPSKKVLCIDDVVILDTAPIVEGYVGDIGYTLSLQPHAELQTAMNILRYFRKEIPKLFASRKTSKEILHHVNSEIKKRGYDNCHSLYPFSVLGHRVYKVPLSTLPGIVAPFGLHAYWALLSRGLFPELLGPHHEGEKVGVWAIEPHLGAKGFGAKFEEILVVEDSRAYWLDDHVPHK